MNATIQATLTANSSQFTSSLNNASAQAKQLENQLKRSSTLPLPGEGDRSSEIRLRSQEKLAAARSKWSAQEAAELSASMAASRASADAAEDAARRKVEAAKRAAFAASGAAPGAPIPATPGARPRPATPAADADTGGVVGLRKRLLQTAGSIGASDLLKGAGIGALVMGFRAALNNAQQLREEARGLGKDLDPAVAATARVADGFDRLKGLAFSVANKLIEIPDAAVNGAVALAGAAAGLGTISENMAAIKADTEAAARGAAIMAEREVAAKKAAAALDSAELDLVEARIAASKAEMTTQEQIALAEKEIKATKEEIAKIGIADASSADPEERARAARQELEVLVKTKQLVVEQADLDALRRTQKEEMAAAAASAADAQRTAEQKITAEKEKQVAVEAQLAKQREEANAKLASAVTAVQAARQAYATALSDQSAASLSEVASGQRGSPADQRKAAEVERLRTQARQARDAGRLTVRGGQAVSVADELSTRANQVQAGIQSLNTAEKNPLAGVTEQLEKANAELFEIKTSLALMEVPA